MNPIQKKNAEFAFNQIKSAFEKLTMPETKDYYLVLGNFNEVHLIRKDAKKSVFLGRLIINNDDELKPAMQSVWNTLRDYFLKPKEEVKPAEDVSKATVVELEDFSKKEEKVESKPVKKTRAKKTAVVEEVKEETPVTPVIEPIEDDGSSIDPEAEDAFSDWTDRMGA